jgi:hypothetical protein
MRPAAAYLVKSGTTGLLWLVINERAGKYPLTKTCKYAMINDRWRF